jgi:hypothetical protein
MTHSTVLTLTVFSLALSIASGQALSSDSSVFGPGSVYAGDTLYLGIIPGETAGTPYRIDSVHLGGVVLAHELNCRIYSCPKDSAGRFYTEANDEVVLGARIVGVTPGTYTLRVAITVNGSAKVYTQPLTVQVSPAALPPPPLINGPAVPGLAKWETTMLTLGSKWCPGPTDMAFGDYSGVWYYDGARAYFQMADYTGNQAWETCALNIARQYRDWALARNGAVFPWSLFPHGLAMAYQRTGDPSFKQAVELMSTRSQWAWWLLGADDQYIREIAYIVNAHVEAEKLGSPRHPNLARRVDYLLAHFDRLFVSNNYTIHQTVYDAVAVEALIYYYELTRDPRIPPAVKKMLDWTWDVAWNKSTNQLLYNPDPYGPKCNAYCLEYISDLINLTAPAFAWYWNVTGNSLYQYRGDELFKHALDSDISYSGKIFSQNFKWSFEYVRWRRATRGQGSCTYAVSPASASLAAAGGTVSLQVSGEAACGWTADSNAGWAAISTGASGSGNGTVTVTAAANTAATARTATLTVAGKSVTVTQAAAAACTYTVSPGTASVSAEGGTVALQVTAGTGCTWTATSPVAWAQVASSGTTVTVTVAANTA